MINELTKEQIGKFSQYVKEGVEIGLSTHVEFDPQAVRDMIDDLRVSRGLKKAEIFEVYDSPTAAIEKYKGDLTPSNALYGSHDINWLQFYQFFRNECGLVEETEITQPLYNLTKIIGWFWLSSTHTIITKKYTEIHMAEKNTVLTEGLNLKVLHNPDGMAIKYADGNGLYALNGVVLEPWMIEQQPLSAEKVMSVINVEQRNELLKLLGPDEMEKQLPTKTLDTFTDVLGSVYRLYTIEIGANTRTYLKGHCPSSGKEFNEAVPPTVTQVKEALTWREWENVSVPGGYLPPLVRT